MHMTIRELLYRLLILFFFITLSFFSPGQEVPFGLNEPALFAQEELDEEQQIIREGLDTLRVKNYFTDKEIRSYLYGELTNFYASRAYRLAWYSKSGPREVFNELAKALEEAPKEGLTFDYQLDTLRSLTQQLFSKPARPYQLRELARLDFLTTAAYLTYASHLLSGLVNPDQYDKSWVAQPRSMPIAAHLQNALQTGKIHESLRQLAPTHQQYAQLKSALAQYQAIADRGGWPSLPPDTVLRKGDTSEVVLLLRQRLQITGDLAAQESGTELGNKSDREHLTAGAESVASLLTDLFAINPATILDESVAAGLAHYQARNGLLVDTILGPNTLKMMNIPAERRVRQIQLNMERLRWWPQSFGEKYVLVNVPEYRLRVYEEQEKKLEMKVIVGEEYHSTPIFRDTIRYIEFSPTWTVPRSIAVNEILPALKRDPGYLQRNHMHLYRAGRKRRGRGLNPYRINWARVTDTNFRYWIVQQPGPHNALGNIKFMFPNKRAIYLHDTPSDYLFDRTKRAFSHGCVRVENPVDLATYLLKENPAWDRQRIQQNMHRDQPVAQPLPELVPVQFLYQTAFVDEEGKVNFREDIYGHDQKQLEAIPVE